MWIKRIAILYLFWMIVYFPFYGLNGTTFKADKNEPLLLTLIFGYFHLWYVSAILFAGLILFKLKEWPIGRIILVAVVLYSIGAMIQYTKYFLFYDIPYWTYRNFMFFALPMMMGLAAAKFSINRISQKEISLALLCSAGLFCIEIAVAHRFNGWGGGFDMYIALLILCPAIFVACAKHELNLPLKNLSLLSSVIYFTHVLFFALLSRNGLNGGILLFAITVMASFATFLAVAKLPKKYRAVF